MGLLSLTALIDSGISRELFLFKNSLKGLVIGEILKAEFRKRVAEVTGNFFSLSTVK